MIVVGLTGSIGMGKSATARMFAELGAAVQDADAEVSALYAPGGEAVGPVLAQFPSARGEDGGVDRARLGAAVLGKPQALAKLESIVHPLVAQRRTRFLEQQRAAGTRVAVLEVQLLFEIGREGEMDKVVVVTAPAEVQRARALARPGMTEAKLAQILARQVPDARKRERADFVIDTSQGFDSARRQVAAVMAQLVGDDERRH